MHSTRMSLSSSSEDVTTFGSHPPLTMTSLMTFDVSTSNVRLGSSSRKGYCLEPHVDPYRNALNTVRARAKVARAESRRRASGIVSNIGITIVCEYAQASSWNLSVIRSRFKSRGMVYAPVWANVCSSDSMNPSMTSCTSSRVINIDDFSYGCNAYLENKRINELGRMRPD